MEKPNLIVDAVRLRHQAQTRLQDSLTPAHPPPPATVMEMQRLIYELQFHQIKLEMQNQALLETRTQLEKSLKRYADLYDFAPIGYFVLTANGTILETNLAGAVLLDQERPDLLDRRFGLFVSTETRPAFNAFLDNALVSTTKVCCEVTLTRERAPPRHMYLEGVGKATDAGQQCRLAAINVTERKLAEDWIKHLAYHDALTQLPNRTLLTDRLQQAMARTQRDQNRLAVCYLDLDGFKLINDTWGHTHGDRVLVEVAHRLKSCVRANDTVARLGGDEFVLLLGNLADLAECKQALDRVVTALRVPFVVSDHRAQLSVSIGVTLYPDDKSDPDTLLRHTDQAMYTAKQVGGNRYQLFNAEYEHRTSLQQIQDGQAAGELRLYYQPKVDMRHGAVVGADSLIR